MIESPSDNHGATTNFGTICELPSKRAKAIAVPRFALIPNSIVMLNGRRCVVERRIGDKWQFLDESSHEPHFVTDLQIRDLQKSNHFHVAWQPGDCTDPQLPVAPLNVGKQAHEISMRKLAYVTACLQSPDYCRSRRVLQPIIAKVAGELSEEPKGFSTVLSWIDRYERWGSTFGPAALANCNYKKGRYGRRLAEYQEQAIEVGIKHWLQRSTKSAAYASVAHEVRKLDDAGLIDKSGIDPAFLDDDNHLRPPSQRQFERRCEAVDPRVRDAMRIGARYARQHYRTYGTNPLPERPYSQVEVDHCTLDIQIKHPKGTVLGRPDLVVFRDRATALIIGWGIGFEEPNYASFMNGLESAIYGPDVSKFPDVKNVPRWCGRIENLYHDNAFHFIGDSIKNAALQLRINLVRLQPREPWLKGQLEAWFRKLGVGLVHKLPGTTLEHVIARRDHEHLGKATLTLNQFEALLARWICDVYNVSPTKTLGFIRGAVSGESPLDAWNAKAKDYETDLLPNKEVFVALAGVTDDCTIQKNGITLDHIIYESSALASIIGNPKHKRKGMHGEHSTHYKVARDPHNLGHVFLVDHHTGNRLEVPATSAHAEYATGLTLTEHQIVVANARRIARDKRKLHIRELIATKAELNDFASAVLGNQKVKTVQRRMARFIEGDRLRAQRSNIQSFAPDGSDYLEEQTSSSTTRVVPDPGRKRQAIITSTSTSGPRMTSPILPRQTDDEDDLAELRKLKNWK